ncbi:MAG: hypothetical protein COZ70_15380 [Deltaproteobacteria bacterium CG_4_8_14_3_um_filter_51_11]|nr:MAG: hypothetical protein AUK25_05820 [Desulfobacteraceae bacterium CG2_30_51_40]PIX18215.1 MAG: hypothetical protein COZ70_15380 [Deltaproteobacteria bacterium CG_4_8_14_3_um_filter_51_11]PIY22558.1 MAG: hypothetical protein COZ11_12170 [Deltaproteobacteria bacterium CG_4_10_14_3_um_filter_51_14]
MEGMCSRALLSGVRHPDSGSSRLLTWGNSMLHCALSFYPSPSTGEGGVGAIFILLCALSGHGV